MPGTAKVDHKRTLDPYRAREGSFRFVDVPPLRYLAIDGHGDPNTSTEYASAVTALFPLAYAIRSASRRELGLDYVVMPLEGLWWAADLAAFTAARDESEWDWTLLIMQPDWITPAMLDAARAAVRDRSARLAEVRLEILHEGRCVQTLHVGPYDAEGEVLARMHDKVIPSAGLRPAGKHHEIYLSDARRVAPARLRTVLRQPVEAVSGGLTVSR